MPEPLDGRRAETQDQPSAASVRDYIERNPEILASLFIPHAAERHGVIDLQRHIVDGLRHALEQQQSREAQILSAAEQRALAVARIHDACRIGLEATSLDDLFVRVSGDFPPALDIDSASLVTEDRVVPTRFEALFGRYAKIRLGAPRRVERVVLGPRAKSVATITLTLPDWAPRTILLLGSVDPDAFDVDHGTELLEFLGAMIAYGLEKWLQPLP